MCYDIKVSLERQLKVAKQYGDLSIIDEIEKKLLPLLNPIEKEYHQVSGFAHPKAFILSKNSVERAQWGLVPNWTKDEKSAKEIWNKTLNARGESIFEKPTFKEAAVRDRCVLFVDGFYENHHLNRKTFPYFIQRKDKNMLPLAALSSKWIHPISKEEKKTFTIVTCKANSMMKRIHNNPKLKEARMPLILEEKAIEDWLNIPASQEEHAKVDQLINPYDAEKLISYTVRKTRKGITDDEKSSLEFIYPEFGPTLFD